MSDATGGIFFTIYRLKRRTLLGTPSSKELGIVFTFLGTSQRCTLPKTNWCALLLFFICAEKMHSYVLMGTEETFPVITKKEFLSFK